MLIVFAFVSGFVGLAIGSFLNVVIWRVPRGESVVRPASHCPGCGIEILPRDNVPVVSWLVLRGKCRGCKSAISVRYPLVEVTTAALFVAVSLRIGAHAELPAYLYLVTISVALAMIDIDVQKLPNVIVLPSYLVVVGLLSVAAVVDGDVGALVRALVGMTIYYGAFFLLVLVKPGAMGFGDVKLAGVLGLCLGYLGWGVLAVGAFGGILLGGVAGLALLSVRRASRKTRVPYGPFMLTGAMLAVFVGSAVAHLYVHMTNV